jgi:hypothetical protein
MRKELENLIGDKQLIDISNNEVYEYWYIDIESVIFIAVNKNGERNIQLENVLLIGK